MESSSSSLGGDRRRLGPAALSLPLVAANVGLLLVYDLAHRLALTLALLGAAFLGLLWAARRLEAVRASTGGAVLLGALLLRLPLLPLPPTLSDDVLRYLWDGRVAAAGFNPYALAPASERLTPLRDEAWRRLPHTQVPTIYPPLSIAAFSIASRTPFPILCWKTMATAADLLACWLLLKLARRLGLPAARVAWYAWNPLVVLEVAGMGHVDALGVAAAVGAVLCLVSRPPKTGEAAVWAAAGVLAKLAPLAAFPLWARRSGRPGRFLVMAGGLVALAVLPVLAATRGIPPGLAIYGKSWEFNGPLFEPLWRLLAAAGAAPALARGLDQAKDWTGLHTELNFVYPYLYPQFLAKMLLAAGVAGVIALSLREADAADGTGRLFGRALLCSATFYPWYLLWVLPWAALRRDPAWLALSGLMPLAYLAQRGGVELWPWVYLGIWGPFLVLSVLGRWGGMPSEASPPGPLSRPLPPSLTGRGGEGSSDLENPPGIGTDPGAGSQRPTDLSELSSPPLPVREGGRGRERGPGGEGFGEGGAA